MQLGLAHRAVRTVARRGVHRSATGVALLGEQKRLGVPSSPQDVVGGVQQCAADAPPGVRRVDEHQKYLPRFGMHGDVADHAMPSVGRDEQRVRRRVVGDQLIPVPCRVHRWLRGVAKERPARPHRGVEDRSNPLGILSERAAHRELARGGLGSLHTIEHAREPTRADLRQPTTAADAHDPATCPRHPHGVDRGHSLGVVAEPEYPRITDVHEQPTTIDVILASDPELRFDGQPQRRAICTLYGADGSIAVAISDLPEDLEHGPRTLAEQLAESMMTGGRITLTGPLCSSRMYPTIAIGWANSLSGAGCCSSTDSSTPRNIAPATPSEFVRVDDPWGWPPDR